ncbi:GNAT family N-acetyltransferase [Brevibacillus choshinensis]|uniref:GNAT family N-acetyltransferase n=1 Tax=Brevibacillus choshinensis TaxID=54911 RepID=UPI002E20A48C|nr:GNAT family N-acetyltransferase [Brevibacillus choshinensis]MED4753340.1 GNAT family N-acetyltransferase [Brevibacillus choshinensis]
MSYNVYTHAQRTDLDDQIGEVLEASWSAFMLHDEVANQYYPQLDEWFGAFQYVLTDDNDRVMAVGNAIPFYWDGTAEDLPKGWDDVFLRGIEGYRQELQPNTLSALSISIHPKYRGLGLSRQMVTAMKEIAKQNGLEYMVAPVRPSIKYKYPLTPMDRYIQWNTAEGAPFDPWVRTHWKLGAKIVQVAEESMFIRGSLAEWESWTGMKFPESGTYIIPDALTPVQIDVEKNEAVYIEPNIWMQHFL